MLDATDWSGRSIQLAASRGGVKAFVDPLAGLVRGAANPWPPPEIVQKLYKSRQERAFSGDDLTSVTSRLGFYTDLQSVHSEDAITWCVFGTVAHAEPHVRTGFVEEFFGLLEIPGVAAESVISLWRRIPHPETLVSGGPELDALIVTATTVVFVEAKWMSSVGTGQGRNRNRDQVGLRVEFLEKFASRMWPNAESFAVIGASWKDPVITPMHRDALSGVVRLGEITWERLCSMDSHPCSDELRRHYEWKAEHTRAT